MNARKKKQKPIGKMHQKNIEIKRHKIENPSFT